PAPSTRTATTNVPSARLAASSSVSGLNADIFELPRGLLQNHKMWSCTGKMERITDNPWAFSYNDGWTYVGRIRPGQKLVLNTKESTGSPKGSNCQPLDESELTEL
ncbi:unnamed protein product, partial [Symbiodinium pilosum]